MSSNILAINRQVLTPELVADAAKDARKLRQDIEQITDMAVLFDRKQVFDGIRPSPFMLLKIRATTIGRFAIEAPSLFEVLRQMQTIPTTIKGVAHVEESDNYDLTINYFDDGTEVNKHRDSGKEEGPKVSRVATLCGKGLFGIVPVEGVELIEPITVEAGDIHELFNPSKPLQRPFHWATSTDGNVERISVAYQVRAIVE